MVTDSPHKVVGFNPNKLVFINLPVNAGMVGPKTDIDQTLDKLEMWANAQRDGRPAEHRWRPLFNAAKFG